MRGHRALDPKERIERTPDTLLYTKSVLRQQLPAQSGYRDLGSKSGHFMPGSAVHAVSI